jgi:hypothetical protein
LTLAACLFMPTKVIAIGATVFTLSWIHSVEKTEWRENWRLTEAGLEIVEARAKGSGAGMDPGEGARLEGPWWVWKPELPPIDKLVLSNSGRTVSGWTICTEARCTEIPAGATGTMTIAACQRVAPPPRRSQR